MANMKKQRQSTRQIEDFKKTARDLECDESEKAFDKTLRKIGAAKPAPSGKK